MVRLSRGQPLGKNDIKEDKMPPITERLNIRFDTETRAALAQVSDRERIPQSTLIRIAVKQALSEWLRRPVTVQDVR
jgi:hypothetical protein